MNCGYFKKEFTPPAGGYMSGKAYPRFGAFCLETQLWPDAVNHDNFPSAQLKPEEVYSHKTVYRFGIEK